MASPETRSPAARPRVLCVEDSDFDREAMLMLLETMGYRVDEASSVAQALARVESASYAAVVSDFHLGDGCAADILAHGVPPQSMVVVTGSPGLTYLTNDVAAILPKPVDPRALEILVRNVAKRVEPLL